MGQFRKAPASRAHQSSTSRQAKPEAGRRRAPSTVRLLQASDDAGHCWSAARLRWAGEPWPQECSALVLGELGGLTASLGSAPASEIPSTAVFPLLVRLEQVQHQPVFPPRQCLCPFSSFFPQLRQNSSGYREEFAPRKFKS